MKNAYLALALAAGAAIANTASADLLAYWNFNASTAQSGSGTLGVLNSTAVNAGAGTLTIGGGLVFNTTATSTPTGHVGTFAGNTLNSLFGDVSGGALTVVGSIGNQNANPVTANSGWVQFAISTSGYSNLVMTFAGRGTGTGFGSAASPNTIQTSTDGVNFSNFATYESRQTSFNLYTFNFGAGLNNQGTVYVRLLLDGATSGNGNNRIDNVQFNATAIPAPGALALVGLGGLVAARRRRA
ncbi:MAG TPA: PEP-CTERM sorting domain-containing protein [Phycisphaerales bacterium]